MTRVVYKVRGVRVPFVLWTRLTLSRLFTDHCTLTIDGKTYE